MPHVDPYALTLVQGKRYQKTFRWPQDVKAYKQITAMPAATPVRFTVTGHQIPDGWKVKITGVKGPTQLNDRELYAKVVDANTIEFNALNAADLPAYVSGGYLEYYLPVDLSGYTGQAMFKESVLDALPALELSTANGRMILDTTNYKITFDVPGSVLAAMTKYSGVWDWEMTKDGNTVSPLGERQLPAWALVREGVTP
jgi:hypothetical protein